MSGELVVDTKPYIRSLDGARMVAFKLGFFVNEALLQRFGVTPVSQ